MTRYLTIVSLILLSFFLHSCGGMKEQSADVAYYDYAEDAGGEDETKALEENSPAPPPDNVTTIERKLIKEGDISFEVENLTETTIKVLTAVKANKGYISNDREYGYSYQKSHYLEIRVPADNFDKLLADISEGVESFDNKNIQVKDVTEEFLDIQARLKTKKELEQRYRELLQKAQTVDEILNIEREIGILRSDIESIEGRLKYLTSQVSLSTIRLTYYQTLSTGIDFSGEFGTALKQGWKNLIWFFVGMTYIWPFIIIIGGGVFLLVRMIRRRRKRKNQTKA